MGTSAPWNRRVTEPESTKMMLLRPLVINWRWPLETTVLFFHVSSPNRPSAATHSVYKSSHPLLVKGWGGEGGVGGSWPLDRCLPPSPPVASIWNKANFPFRLPGLLLAFERQAARCPHAYLSITLVSLLWEKTRKLGGRWEENLCRGVRVTGQHSFIRLCPHLWSYPSHPHCLSRLYNIWVLRPSWKIKSEFLGVRLLCLCPLHPPKKVICWNPNPKYDIQRWDLWQVIRSWGAARVSHPVHSILWQQSEWPEVYALVIFSLDVLLKISNLQCNGKNFIVNMSKSTT